MPFHLYLLFFFPLSPIFLFLYYGISVLPNDRASNKKSGSRQGKQEMICKEDLKMINDLPHSEYVARGRMLRG